MSTGQDSFNNIFVVLAKAALLIIIIFCIFFIVTPNACHNFMSGNMVEDGRDLQKPLTPANKDKAPEGVEQTTDPLYHDEQEHAAPSDKQVIVDEAGVTAETPKGEEELDYNDLTPEEFARIQDEFDYNVIKKYVAAETEYLKKNANDSKAAQNITKLVLQETGLTDKDWQDILLKANERGWFEKARAENK